jgi:hypothetical protein
MEARVELADDVEERTPIFEKTERRAVLMPCLPCQRSGSIAVAVKGRVEAHICPICRGSGFNTVVRS